MMPVVRTMTGMVVDLDEPLSVRRLNQGSHKEKSKKRDKRKYLHATCDAFGLPRVLLRHTLSLDL
jgi:hypothetical protein